MKFLSFQEKKPAIAAAPDRVVLHLYALGGSGAILGLVTLIQMLSMDDSPTRFDLRVNAMDFDANSDAHALLMQTTEVLCSMLVDLSKERDISRVLGALRSASIANHSVLNHVEPGETVGSCVQRLADGQGGRAALAEGLKLLVEPKTHDIVLGNGGYGSPVAGAMIAASHATAIENVMRGQIDEANTGHAAKHVHLVTAGLTGATGFALLPEVLEHLRGQKHVFCLLDGGVFLPHSNAFAQENYQGTREVSKKAQSALNGLYRRELLNSVNCIVLHPLNQAGDAHNLCPACNLASTQARHTSIEYLLGADEIMRRILKLEGDGGGILDLTWNDDMGKDYHPLGWGDLGLDGVKYHRLLRKLALGASTQGLIWNQDDAFIRNIPAIDTLLRNGAFFPEIKEQGIKISNVCHGLLQMFWDFAVTGTNLENLNNEEFHEEDHFRLLNIPELDNVLKNNIASGFQVKGLCCYKEFTATRSGQVKEKAVAVWEKNITLKAAIDSTRDVQSLNDFYLQLFRSVV